jgi:tetratricopeptide (TPR) repeat protein
VRLGALALMLASLVPAQTLERAEAFWKARRFQESNEEFRALVAKYPTNPDYRVRWGRLFLERSQPEEAAGLFQEGLELRKEHPGALVGLALIAADTFEGSAEKLASRALAADPKLLEAQELLARLALEDNNNEKAAAEAKNALAIDRNSVQGKAILASMDWLADKKDSPWDPHDARGYETAGHFFVLNRRYEEGIEYFRRAIAMDPQLYSARAKLGINLMRLGQSEEAYKQLETCFNNGFQDKATRNSLKLMDSSKNFVTFRTPTTVLMLHKKEASLLRPYFESEMQRAITTFEKKYRTRLEGPVQVEAYPDHEDFAVRTLGMPGLGALGVTFGRTVAMDSPSGRTPGSFHWASTMWHELSHVYTLTITRHRVPRWFTEGMAVHEETAASPEWGDRLGPDEISAVKNKQLLPVTELDRGFIHPVSPAQVAVSYFQAGRICDFINEKWGWDTLLAMLRDFGQNEETATVVRKELKVEPEEFDRRFLAYLEADVKRTVESFDTWKKAMKQVSELAAKKDFDGVIQEGTPIRDLYPDYVEHGSVYEMLATAHFARNDKAAGDAELERYVKRGGRNPEALKTLSKNLEEAGRKKEAAEVLERLNYIYPMDETAHQRLGGLWLDLGNAPKATREFQAVLARGPIDPARAHYDLARAYRMDRRTELATEELLAALEAAPGYRPAQKLLLELSAAETGEGPRDTIRK